MSFRFSGPITAETLEKPIGLGLITSTPLICPKARAINPCVKVQRVRSRRPGNGVQ